MASFVLYPKGYKTRYFLRALNFSKVWNDCKVLRLMKNMRLRLGLTNVDELLDFAEYILKVGNGKLGGPTMERLLSTYLKIY